MGTIALRYGINLSDLVAANPDVNPRAMSVGAILVIPAAPAGGVEKTPAPAAVEVSLEAPSCQVSSSGGVWCLAMVKNIQPYPVENVSVRWRLIGSDGETDPVVANTPLDRLLPGDALPVVVMFAPPLPAGWQPVYSLEAALPGQENDPRYLPVAVDKVEVDIAPGGASARVQGKILLAAAEEIEASIIRVAVTSYDDAGHPIGIRLWEGKGTINSQQGLGFDTFVYSVGGKIARVEVNAEARR